MRSPARTLVLGAGGPVGAAWLGGLSQGLLRLQVDLRSATEIVGTSAGAVLGTWLLSGRPLTDFLAAMADRARWHADRPHHVHAGVLARAGYATDGGHPGEEEIRQLASDAARVITPRDVREVVAEWSNWLPNVPWPRPLHMVSVDAATGRPRVWHSGDGLTVAAGVATTTAAPGAAAPVLLGGRSWVDGCARSYTNADLITEQAGSGRRVLVLAPVVTPALDAEVATLRKSGASVVTVSPDEYCRTLVPDPMAVMGDREAAAAMAEAGRSQAAAEARRLHDWWPSELSTGPGRGRGAPDR